MTLVAAKQINDGLKSKKEHMCKLYQVKGLHNNVMLPSWLVADVQCTSS